MKRYNSTTDISYLIIAAGIIIIIAPFVMASLIPIIEYLANLLTTLGVVWYIFYPAMGGTMIMIGFIISLSSRWLLVGFFTNSSLPYYRLTASKWIKYGRYGKWRKI